MKKLVSLAVFLAMVLLLASQCTVAYAWYTNQEVLYIHQNKYQVATDLHVKFWEKWDNVNVVNWQVLGTSGGLPFPSTQGRGWQPWPYTNRVDNWGSAPPTANPDNGLHAVDLNWYNLAVPYCSRVDVRFRWTLTRDLCLNQKLKDIRWTYGEGWYRQGPLMGWDVGFPVWDPFHMMWRHRVTLSNLDDPSDPLSMPGYFQNLRYWALQSDAELGDDTLAAWSDWNNAPLSPFALLPGESQFFDVYTPWQTGRILGNYDVYGAPGGAYEDLLISDVFDHTVVTPEPGSLLAFGSGLTGLAGMIIRRRR